MSRSRSGSVVVAAAFGVLLLTYGVQYSFGLFFTALAEHFGWRRAALSGVFSLYAATYSLLAVTAGRLTDRWGPRPVVAAGALALGGGLALAGAAQSLAGLYGAYLLAGVGMSTAYVPCAATVTRRFAARRGLIVGLALSGASVGVFVCPPVTAWLIATLGWRQAYVIVGTGLTVALGLLALGLSSSGPDPVDPDAGATSSWPPAAAIREPRFLALLGVYVATWTPAFVPLVHLPAFADDLGLSSGTGAAALSVLGAGSLAGRIVLGALSDRIPRRATLALALGFQAVGFVGLTATSGLALLMWATVAFGVGSGGVVGLMPTVVADFFGPRHAGSLVGLIVAAAGVPMALGPLLSGWLFDATGRYDGAFLAGAVLNLIGLALLVVARPPATSRRGG